MVWCIKPNHRLLAAFATGIMSLLTACTEAPPTSDSSPTSPAPSSPPIASPSPTTTPSATPSAPTSPSPSASPSGAKSAATQQTEEKLRKTLTEAGEVAVQSVTCPSPIEFQVSKTYACQVASSVGSFTVTIDIKDQKGDFKWATKGLLVLSKLEEYIQKSTKEKGGGDVQVTCDGKVRLAKPGDEFQCKVTDTKGQSRIAKVTVQDEQGNVFFTLL